jgi:sugar O-acyltransferase, sialic acid O-acetyltransferase NeuD family
MKKIIVYGCGGQGREAVQLIKDINKIYKKWEIIGFIDDDTKFLNKVINGIPVLGQIHVLENYRSDDIYVTCAVGGSSARRKIVFNIMKTYSFVKFATLIHPSAVISENAEIGSGTIIAANTTVSTNVIIGEHVLINYNVSVGHDSNIEQFASVYPGSNISGDVKILEASTIGSGSVLLPSVVVGQNSIVGAGAVVTKNLPQNCTAVGVPARVIKIND